MNLQKYIDFSRRSLAMSLSLSILFTSSNIAQAGDVTADLFAHASNLPQFQLMPPAQLGRVADYFNAEGKSDGAKERTKQQERIRPLVILIQDLHAHYGVQKNISGILDFLSKKLAENSIAPSLDHSLAPSFALAVEGAQGPIDSSILATFPDQKIKAQAADYLMRQGELTGAEDFAVLKGIPNLLVGVEDNQYYELNRDLFRKTLADRQELVSLLSGLQADLKPLEDRTYSGDLREFQKKVHAYEHGEMSTHEFIGVLMDTVGAGPRARPQSESNEIALNRRFGQAQGPAPTIDLKRDFPILASFASNSHFGTMDQVRAATNEFLTQTQSVLTPEEKMDLKVLAKSSSTSTYYLYLRDLVYQKKLFMAVPPELAQYMEYIHTAQTMGMDRVTHEARELAFKIQLGLARGQREGGIERLSDRKNSLPPSLHPSFTPSPSADLIQVLHDLDLLARIADLQATEFEVQDFGKRLNPFIALCKSLLESNGIKSFDEAKVRELISSSIDYYAMAIMRNKPMVENTLALLGEQAASSKQLAVRNNANHRLPLAARRSPSVAVLVAGGFHTRPITELLRQKNISYLVITPTIEHVTDADHDLYVKRLNGDLLTISDVLSDANTWSSSTFAKVSRADRSANTLTPGTLGKIIGAGVLVATIFGVWAHVTGHAPNLASLDIFNHLPAMSAWVQSHADALASIKTFLVGGAGAMAMLPGHTPRLPGEPLPLISEGHALVLQNLIRFLDEAQHEIEETKEFLMLSQATAEDFQKNNLGQRIAQAAELAGSPQDIAKGDLQKLDNWARDELRPLLLNALIQRFVSADRLGDLNRGLGTAANLDGPKQVRAIKEQLIEFSDVLDETDRELVRQILMWSPRSLAATRSQFDQAIRNSRKDNPPKPILTGIDAALARLKEGTWHPKTAMRHAGGGLYDSEIIKDAEEARRGIRAGLIVDNPDRKALEFAPGKHRKDIPAFTFTDEAGRTVTIGVETAEDYLSARYYKAQNNAKEADRYYDRVIQAAPTKPGDLFERHGRLYKVDRVQLESDSDNHFHFLYHLVPANPDPNAEQSIFGLRGLKSVSPEEANQVLANQHANSAKQYLDDGKPIHARDQAQEALTLVPEHHQAQTILNRANEVIRKDEEAKVQRQLKQEFDRSLTNVLRQYPVNDRSSDQTPEAVLKEQTTILQQIDARLAALNLVAVPEGLDAAIAQQIRTSYTTVVEGNRVTAQRIRTDAELAIEQTTQAAGKAQQALKDEVAKLQAMRQAIAENRVGRAAHIFDVHGDPGIIEDVIQLVKRGEIDEVIFHGDAFDRGKQNFEVLAKFKELKTLLGDKFVLIFGNHDVWMVQAMLLDDRDALENWLRNDGLPVFYEAGVNAGLLAQIDGNLKQQRKLMHEYQNNKAKNLPVHDIARQIQALARDLQPLLPQLLRDPNARAVREMARWMAANQQFHFVDERGILHVHAGIPLDKEGRAPGIKAKLEAGALELAKRKMYLQPDQEILIGEKDKWIKLFAEMNDIFWVREKQWVDRLLVDKGGQVQLKNPQDASKLEQVKEMIRQALRQKGTSDNQMEDLVAQNLPHVLPKFNIALVKQAPKVDGKRLQAFLDDFGIQGVMFGHDHHPELNNVDARIFGADLDQKAFMIHDHAGIKLRDRTASQDEIEITKEEILARLDKEIARKAVIAGIDLAPKQTPAEIIVAPKPQSTGTQRGINFQKQELLDNGQGLVIRWADNLFSIRVRVSTTDPSLVRISAVRVGKNLTPNPGTIKQGQSLWIGRDTIKNQYAFHIATEKPANFQESRRITNSNGSIVVQTADGASSKTSVETETLPDASPQQMLLLLARLLQDVGVSDLLAQGSDTKDSPRPSEPFSPFADQSAGLNYQVQALDVYLRKLTESEDQRTLFMRTLKLIAATVAQNPSILSTRGIPQNILERYQDAAGSQDLLRSFVESIDYVRNIIPADRLSDYGPIADTLETIVTNASGGGTLTHKLTRHVGDVVGGTVRTYYRLTGQRAKANEIGVRRSSTRRNWIQETFAPRFEKFAFLLFAETFERWHGAIESPLREERNEAARTLGQIARHTFDDLLTTTPARKVPFLAANIAMKVLPNSGLLWLQVLLNFGLAIQAANATIAPHSEYNLNHRDDGAALVNGASFSVAKNPQLPADVAHFLRQIATGMRTGRIRRVDDLNVALFWQQQLGISAIEAQEALQLFLDAYNRVVPTRSRWAGADMMDEIASDIERNQPKPNTAQLQTPRVGLMGRLKNMVLGPVGAIPRLLTHHPIPIVDIKDPIDALAQEVMGTIDDPSLRQLYSEVLGDLKNDHVILTSPDGSPQQWDRESMRRVLLFVKDILEIMNEIPEGIMDRSDMKIPLTIQSIQAFGQVAHGKVIISIKQHEAGRTPTRVEIGSDGVTNKNELRDTVIHEALGHKLTFQPSKSVPDDFALPHMAWQEIAKLVLGFQGKYLFTKDFIQRNVDELNRHGKVVDQAFLLVTEAIAYSLTGNSRSHYVKDPQTYRRIRELLSEGYLVDSHSRSWEFNVDGRMRWTVVPTRGYNFDPGRHGPHFNKPGNDPEIPMHRDDKAALNPGLRVGKSLEEDDLAWERTVYALHTGGMAWRVGEAIKKRRFIQSRVKDPVVYYLGIGSPTNTKGGLSSNLEIGIDVAMPLMETDFTTLIGADRAVFDFEGFKTGIRLNLSRVADPATGKNLTDLDFSQESDGAYVVRFSYNNRARTVKVYAGRDLNAEPFIPSPIQDGYHVLMMNGAGFYATEDVAPKLFDLLVPGQGVVLLGESTHDLEKPLLTRKTPVDAGGLNPWHYMKQSGQFEMSKAGEYDTVGNHNEIWLATKKGIRTHSSDRGVSAKQTGPTGVDGSRGTKGMTPADGEVPDARSGAGAYRNDGVRLNLSMNQASLQEAIHTQPDQALITDTLRQARRWTLLSRFGIAYLITWWRLFWYGSTSNGYRDAIVADRHLLGQGSQSEVYRTRSGPYVARIPRGTREMLKPGEPISVVTDRLGDLNVGQIVARVGAIEILRMQRGDPAGIPRYQDGESPLSQTELDKLFDAHLKKVAAMPFSAYVGLFTTLQRIALADYAFDSGNPNNLHIHMNRFALTDVHDTRPNFYQRISNFHNREKHSTPTTNLGGVLNVLMDLGFANNAVNRIPGASENLRTIFINVLAANQKTGGLSDRGQDDSLDQAARLAGISDWQAIKSQIIYQNHSSHLGSGPILSQPDSKVPGTKLLGAELSYGENAQKLRLWNDLKNTHPVYDRIAVQATEPIILGRIQALSNDLSIPIAKQNAFQLAVLDIVRQGVEQFNARGNSEPVLASQMETLHEFVNGDFLSLQNEINQLANLYWKLSADGHVMIDDILGNRVADWKSEKESLRSEHDLTSEEIERFYTTVRQGTTSMNSQVPDTDLSAQNIQTGPRDIDSGLGIRPAGPKGMKPMDDRPEALPRPLGIEIGLEDPSTLSLEDSMPDFTAMPDFTYHPLPITEEMTDRETLLADFFGASGGPHSRLPQTVDERTPQQRAVVFASTTQQLVNLFRRHPQFFSLNFYTEELESPMKHVADISNAKTEEDRLNAIAIRDAQEDQGEHRFQVRRIISHVLARAVEESKMPISIKNRAAILDKTWEFISNNQKPVEARLQEEGHSVGGPFLGEAWIFLHRPATTISEQDEDEYYRLHVDMSGRILLQRFEGKREHQGLDTLVIESGQSYPLAEGIVLSVALRGGPTLFDTFTVTALSKTQTGTEHSFISNGTVIASWNNPTDSLQVQTGKGGESPSTTYDRKNSDQAKFAGPTDIDGGRGTKGMRPVDDRPLDALPTSPRSHTIATDLEYMDAAEAAYYGLELMRVPDVIEKNNLRAKYGRENSKEALTDIIEYFANDEHAGDKRAGFEQAMRAQLKKWKIPKARISSIITELWPLAQKQELVTELAHWTKQQFSADISNKLAEVLKSDELDKMKDVIRKEFPHSTSKVPGTELSTQSQGPQHLSVIGQIGGIFTALMHGDFQGMKEELAVAWDIVAHSDNKSLGHYIDKVGAVKLVLARTLQQIDNSPSVIVEAVGEANVKGTLGWGEAMRVDRIYDAAGNLSSIRVLINPHLSIATLKRGAVHELLHALEPKPVGIMARFNEEARVIRQTTKYLAEDQEFFQKAFQKAAAQVHTAEAQIPATSNQLTRDDRTFHNLLVTLHLTKDRDADFQRELDQARAPFLGAA